MRYVGVVQGFEGRELWVDVAGLFARSTLYIDGNPAHRVGKANEYSITRNDGREVVASLKLVNFLDPVPQIVVEGTSYRLAEPLKWYQWVWSGIPFVLYFAGGALGVLFGMIGLYANARLFRSKLAPILRYAATAGVTVLTVGFFLFAATLVQLAVNEWIPQSKTIRSEGGRFTIVAPVELKETTQDINLETGDVMAMHSFSGDRKGIAYFVAYSDYPAGIVRTADVQKMLEGGRDGAVANIGGTLIESHNISLGTHPGLDFTANVIDSDGKAYTLNARMYLVDLRVYEIFVFIPQGTTAGEDVTRFFASFNVIE